MNGVILTNVLSVLRRITTATTRSIMWLWGFLHGYDLFISYAWEDGRLYAVSLSRQLKERGYRCFLDDEQMPPGDELRHKIRRAIRHSSAFVAISTARSVTSPEVARELNAFSVSKRLLVPIFLDSSIRSGDNQAAKSTLQLLRQRVWIDEPTQSTSSPSAVVVDRLVTTLRFVRRARLRLAAVTSVAIVFVIVAVAALVQLHNVETARQLSVSQVLARTQPTEALLVMQEAAGRWFADRSLLPQFTPALLEATLTYRRHVVGDAVNDVRWLRDGGYAAVSANGNTYIWDDAGRSVTTVPARYAITEDEKSAFANDPIPVSEFVEASNGKFFVTADWRNCLRVFVKTPTGPTANETATCVNRKSGEDQGGPWAVLANDKIVGTFAGTLEILGEPSTKMALPLMSDQKVERILGDLASKPYLLLSDKSLIFNVGKTVNPTRLENVSDIGSCSNGRVWAVTSDHLIHWLDRNNDTAALPGSERIRMSDDCTMYVDQNGSVYKITGSKLDLVYTAFAPNWQYSGHAIAISFSPGDSYVAASTSDGSIRILDTRDKSVRLLQGHTQRILAMTFSPDSQRLLTGSFDGSVRIFNLDQTLMNISRPFNGATTIFRDAHTDLPS